ncbi:MULTISPECIES: cupin domain-containing protein [Streptomyces]|uniref:cupin domain-containing protein n=1 Tax=Streptomyces TaxID=1883 RepID=UPI00163C2557|nr:MULTISPECIES: cupin domain-containing protein [Streptomyces]MBC2874848.1 cupin domain-containing protein [Streptomyces sp. TYQ1024]UBI37296.1 cupin domain-containing protein [Streptomyces mobaraensis]UKW29887.1 cupin domain-containing protein [Streptomyces sp. TYQ1024]
MCATRAASSTGSTGSTDVTGVSARLPAAWSSAVVGQVGTAQIKVLRMDGRPVPEERHEAAEALLVLDGLLRLAVDGRPVDVGPGALYTVPAGTPHAVLPGSHGTLVIVERAAD